MSMSRTQILDTLGKLAVIAVIIAVLIAVFYFVYQDTRPITIEQADQINVWRFEQPEIKETIEKYSKDGTITQQDYKFIENAYRAAVANEDVPRVLR